jgi:hypothetical protein
MSPDQLFPDQWPDSVKKERALEEHLSQHYPTDDPRMVGLLGEPGRSTTDIRFRIIRDMLGWVGFQYILGELVSASLLLLAWTAIAWRERRFWMLVLYGFVAMQIIFAVPTNRNNKFVDACSVLLRNLQSGAEASWVMTIGAMERTSAALYRSAANGVIGVLFGLAGFAALVKVRGWTFAGISTFVITILTFLRMKGFVALVRTEIAKPKEKPGGQETSVESAIKTVDATLGRWFSPHSVRPGSGAHLKTQGIICCSYSRSILNSGLWQRLPLVCSSITGGRLTFASSRFRFPSPSRYW